MSSPLNGVALDSRVFDKSGIKTTNGLDWNVHASHPTLTVLGQGQRTPEVPYIFLSAKWWMWEAQGETPGLAPSSYFHSLKIPLTRVANQVDGNMRVFFGTKVTHSLELCLGGKPSCKHKDKRLFSPDTIIIHLISVFAFAVRKLSKWNPASISVQLLIVLYSISQCGFW